MEEAEKHESAEQRWERNWDWIVERKWNDRGKFIANNSPLGK